MASIDQQTATSNVGPCVNIFAPGGQVRSLTRFGGYRFGSGTSAAAPHVSGAAAITALHVHGQLGAAGIVLRPALYPQIIKECLMAAASQGVSKNPTAAQHSHHLYTSRPAAPART